MLVDVSTVRPSFPSRSTSAQLLACRLHHDLTAVRDSCLGALCAAAAQGLPTLTDGGYLGAGAGVR
jgi:hypothetical protein